jgi:hypothetical protein
MKYIVNGNSGIGLSVIEATAVLLFVCSEAETLI